MKWQDLATGDTERQYDSSVFLSKTYIHMFISFPSPEWKQRCFMAIAIVFLIYSFFQ